MENQIDTAYITIISVITSITRSTGELPIVAITDTPIEGIFEIINKVTKKPATGIYINTRPLIEPYL
jgi:hypothetical protein